MERRCQSASGWFGFCWAVKHACLTVCATARGPWQFNCMQSLFQQIAVTDGVLSAHHEDDVKPAVEPPTGHCPLGLTGKCRGHHVRHGPCCAKDRHQVCADVATQFVAAPYLKIKHIPILRKQSHTYRRRHSRQMRSVLGAWDVTACCSKYLTHTDQDV